MNYPEFGTRTERIKFIRYLKRTGQHSEALKFWLRNPKGISKKTFTDTE